MQSQIENNFYGKTITEISVALNGLKLQPFRTPQIWQGLYKNLWSTWDQFTNLSKETREILKEHFSLMQLEIVKELQSQDGQTTKVVFKLVDGKKIETVLMKYKTRNTLCISTQVGCGMNCEFCATGQMGFFRNLSAGEIVQQVLYFSELLSHSEDKLTNVVYMGMGEPFSNYDAVMKSIDILNDHDGFDFSQRRITISTVGLIPQIKQFTKEHRQVNLAISLHTTSDDLRDRLVPINKKFPISELMDACRAYVDETRRQITFEYALMDGINDSEQDAHQLAGLLKHLLCHVNLIPLNATDGSIYHGTNSDTAVKFKTILEQHHIPCSIRLRRGLDIAAGCGQLATQVSEGDGI